MALSEKMRDMMVYTMLPYTILTLKPAITVGFMALLRSTLDPVYGVKPLVLTAYEQLVSATVLFSLALIFDHGRRKTPSFQILSWAFLLGFLQITMCDILLISSLRYITTTVHSVILNISPVGVFILAVLARRETFHFCNLHGLAKLLGVLASTIGAMIVVMVSDVDTNTDIVNNGVYDAQSLDGFWIGVLMVFFAVLAIVGSSLLLERVAIEFSSDFTLSAIMNGFGAIQTVSFAVFMERDLSSWKINTKSHELLAIIYGGTIVTGIFFLGANWCVHTKGPVFSSAFSPLLVVFSFLVDTFILKYETCPRSVIGALLVIGGLYLFLWAKAKENIEKSSEINENDMLESSCTDPLIIQSKA